MHYCFKYLWLRAKRALILFNNVPLRTIRTLIAPFLFSMEHLWTALKPKYSFGKWWKLKIYLMGIVHKSCMSSQSPVNLFVRFWSIFIENCIKLTLSGLPREFSHRDMYIAPSSGHTSFNINMPFKLILRRCEVVF